MSEPAPIATDDRLDDLRQVIEAYNLVTQNLQQSHETLTAEVQRLQHELASANADLQRSRRLAALGEMAAGIAHEVRNPLASIQLYACMLADDLADRPAQLEIARKIGQAVRGLDGVVSDVLTYARPLRVERGPVDAAAALERTADAVRPLLDASRCAVAIDVDAELDQLEADADLLHQALVNLARNAVEAMAPAGGRLTLAASCDGAAVRIVVADTGPGIRDQDIDRIFNPFFTTRHTGTGLGLAIVHRIVDAHGGSIAVHNAIDGGAVFTLTLPASRPAGPARPIIETPRMAEAHTV